MIKKWIGTFLSILLLSGTIAPNAYAVAISSSYTEEQNQVNQIDNTEQSTSETTQEKVQTATEETNSTGKISEESIKTVTIDEEHFPDTNFRNYISETIDTDHNGILSNELIETTELDLSGKQIKSIEGIQYFNYLQKLEVQENELQEIEVASLATLQYLDVSNNHLSTIDLSKNKEITYFDGKEQTIDANAIQVKDQWQITQEKLKPEKDRTVLKTEDWKYDGEKFIADKQSPLIYSYQIPFSSEAILESTSENSLEVTVNVQYTEPTKVESIIPLENTVTMYSGETKQLEYTTVPQNAEITQPIWETSDNSIVQVSRDGKITGLRAGEAEITLKDGERSLGIFNVLVKEEATSSDKTQSSSETDLSTSKESSSLYARKSVSPTVSYQTHVRTFGWQNEVTNGATAGTIGQNKRLEAIKIKLSESPFTGNVEYSSHVQSIGWQGYVNNGATSGTTDQALRTEAIKIRLTGEISQQYDIYYRVHSAYFGWLGWTKNGENAGSSGFGYQMEAIQIQLVKKGDVGPTLGTAYYQSDQLPTPNVNYQTHSQSVGWQSYQSNGATAGTLNRGLRLEAVKINLSNTPLPGAIEYSSHVRSIGWQNYVQNNAISGTTDQKLRMEAIRVRLTGQLSYHYDVYYRVHSAYFGWLGWTKNNANAGSSGFGYQMEAIQIKLVPKGQSGPATSTSYYEKDTLKNPNVNYQTHSQSVGWQNYQMNGATAGTIGKGLRLEAMRMNITNTPLPGTIEYSSHVQSIGWQGYVNNNGLSGTTGSKLRAEAIRIRLTGQLNQFYDVYYRVHSAQLGWLDWARNGQNAGTSNLALQMEAIQVVLVKKGAPAPGAISNPYQTSINHLFVMGHGVLDPGAAYNGINERDFTRKELMPSLQKWASQLKRNRITFYNTNADMYQDSQRLQGAYTVSTSFSSVTEFHLDAGGIGTSTGGHVIAHRNGNSLTTQNYAIANVIRAYVGLWGSVQNTGGISLRSDLLNMNVLNSRGIPYRLAELGFITNINDVANIRRNKDQIAKGIVESVTGEKL
ncbi:hypothetical protein A5844_002281 [Enterococcus sp. 10A9_DIV0425]|uniref:MurNAc-LAA domain-containing protein n=1 Tax=Candidatus Enterococcus wittei TaxID=1987383 RepID=A0A242JXT0_9ENTE|nr:N-acetylmuramoyl-L-alanine amidase [Enterococcus sp. 10A9_DIV0425]OTP09503.1 hypothetical protein A5844_002281 [Enterococcus sp. 10A9_DIV0425]THE09223.1 N-acetylmuramoyl-L-alanine amidase [Enterococcus hirae]